MIDTPLCLVLGAGASCDAGLPTGVHLRDMVYSEIIHDSQRSSRLWNDASILKLVSENRPGFAFPIEVKALAAFAKSLRDAAPESIDSFLMSNPSFARIGKLTIAAKLMTLEDPGRVLYTMEPSGPFLQAGLEYTTRGWYQALWQALYRECESGPDAFLSKNKISIITFNYDRSLEFFLMTRFKAMYGGQQADRLFQSIPIIHVHGSLGEFPILEAGPGRPYSPAVLPEQLEQAAERMKLSVDDVKDLQRPLSRALEHAEVLAFLGFGYDERNLAKLPLKDRYKTIVAGMTGIEDPRRSRIAEKLWARIGTENNSIVSDDKSDCRSILRQYLC